MISRLDFWNAGGNTAVATVRQLPDRCKTLRRSRPAKYALGEFAHFRVPEFPGCSPRAFFPAVAVIAEEPGNRSAAAKKMDLKAVGLFFGARFRVDAPDVLF